MNKLYVIGEMLIDFTSAGSEGRDGPAVFERNAGGAPANVAVCVSRLGGISALVTKLGDDAFGRYLKDVLVREGVDTSYVYMTNEAKTALAFVFLDGRGERDFLFYRDPSADMLLSADDVSGIAFEPGDVLHFGSVDLVDAPVKEAHRKITQRARDAGATVSFDPNLRYPLWKSRDELLSAVREFLPLADIVKVSLDELFDIAGVCDEITAVNKLLGGNTKLIFVTKGSEGSAAYTRKTSTPLIPAEKAHCIDTTGAGDTFIGTVLYQILRDGVTLDGLDDSERLTEYIRYANRAAAITVSGRGAIPSMPYGKDVFGSSSEDK